MRRPAPARPALLRRSARVLQEEPQHLARGIRPARVGVAALGVAARPGMARPVQQPVLSDHGARRADSGIARTHRAAVHSARVVLALR